MDIIVHSGPVIPPSASLVVVCLCCALAHRAETFLGLKAHIELGRCADDDRITVTDLRSTNGTYLDGTEIQSMQAYEVLPGNTLIFGDEHLAMYELQIEMVEDAPAEASPPATAE